MSPRKHWSDQQPRVRAAVARVTMDLGREVREERMRRAWTVTVLAERAGVSPAMVHGVEAGEASSIEGYVRLATALHLQPRFTLLPDRAATSARAVDPVHAAMGEIEAEQFRSHGFEVRLDEPYQHYQFAGRGDVVALDRQRLALLHVENRTRFPDLQGFAGSFNAKRAYLAADLARRLSLSGFRSETHVVVALWSAEVLHQLRLRKATFRSIAPDSPSGFAGWWEGTPRPTGSTTELVVFDPLPGRRRSRRRWIGLDDAERAEPRYRDYGRCLESLRAAARA